MSIYIQAFVAEYLSGCNASQNRIGRLMLREDGTGAIEYFYGKIGEVTKTRRTMIVPNQAIATYVTQWTYDSISVPIYATTPCGSPRGMDARRPTRGRGGWDGLLYIGHRFADDRCLWSEHPCRGASFSAVKLKWSPLGLCAKKESVSILTHPLSGYLISKTSRNLSDSTQVGRSAEAFS